MLCSTHAAWINEHFASLRYQDNGEELIHNLHDVIGSETTEYAEHWGELLGDFIESTAESSGTLCEALAMEYYTEAALCVFGHFLNCLAAGHTYGLLEAAGCIHH